jgi:hypothetical protein
MGSATPAARLGADHGRMLTDVDADGEELLWRFGKAEDPEIEARRQRILDVLLEASPQKRSSSCGWKVD